MTLCLDIPPAKQQVGKAYCSLYAIAFEDQFQIFQIYSTSAVCLLLSDGVKACLESLWTKYRH